MSASSEQPVSLVAVKVARGRLACDISIPDARFRRTTPALAAYALDAFPELSRHACVNGTAPTFGAVVASTSVPHLLEHVAISVQARAASGPGDSFVGSSEWLDEAAGTARVELSFHDDLEALRAFAEAIQFVNLAVLTCLA